MDIFGGNEAETLIGSAQADLIGGGGGDDSIEGLGDEDGLLGQGGNDTLSGGAGDDGMIGGDGLDWVLLDGVSAYDVTVVFGARPGSGSPFPRYRLEFEAGGETDFADEVEVVIFGEHVDGFGQNIVVPPVLDIANAFAVEGDAGTTEMTITVQLSQTAIAPGSVRIRTVAETATDGVDYLGIDTVVTIEAGETQASVTVTILGDLLSEGLEQFRIEVSEPQGVFFAGGEAPVIHGVIVDNEGGFSPGDDVEGTIASTSAIALGDVLTRSLETLGDHDFFRAELEAGQTYLVAMQGASSGSGSLRDPLLNIRDAQGDVLAMNDDGGVVRDAFLSFTPEESGTYFIDAGAFADSGSGTYVLRLYEPAALPELRITGMTVVETAGGSVARLNIITSFPTLDDIVVTASTSGQTAISGNDFVARSAQITIPGGDSDDLGQVGTFDVQIRNDPESEAVETFVVTLSNPTNATIGDAGEAQVAIVDVDFLFVETVVNGVATENDAQAGVGIELFNGPSTGPTVVRYHVIPGTATAADYSGPSEGVLVIPAGETFVSVPLSFVSDGIYEGTESLFLLIEPDDVAGAFISRPYYLTRITIDDQDIANIDPEGEVLIGTQGPDLLIGGSIGDLIDGNPGDDVLLGEDGGDDLFGDDGNDFILGDFILSGPQGPGGDDLLDGSEGNDSILAGPGQDTVIGDDGDDVLVAEDGNDLVQGGDHNDALYGGNGADTLQGDDDDDFLFGEAGADVLDGGSGNDRIYVDQEDSFADGGNGTFDAVTPLGPGSWVIDLGAAGNQNLGAGPALYGFEVVDAAVAGGPVTVTGAVLNGAGNVLYGSAFADSITGSAATDIILGGEGGDHLDGGAGDDSIGAEADDDTVTGGAGADTIFYFASSGAVLITDFTPDEDVLGLASTLAGTAEAALGLAAQVGPDTVFDFGGGQTITLAGVAKSTLDGGDLTFF